MSSRSRNTIRRNATILPAYSFVLGLLALLGWVAIAAGTKPIGLDGKANAQLVIPQLFEDYFPGWFAGVAFAASPSARWCRRPSCRSPRRTRSRGTSTGSGSSPQATHAEEANVSKIVSLVVKGFALVFVLTLDKQNAINFQLLGGIWILQTFPHRLRALHPLVPPLGAARRLGRGHGLWDGDAYNVVNPATGNHFGGSLALIPVFGELGTSL